MVSDKVKDFDCYGEGWVFDNTNVNIDFKKLSIGKGYTISIDDLGILDPILGGSSSEIPWYDDANFILWLLRTTDNVENFKNTTQVKDLIKTLSDDRIPNVVMTSIARNPKYYIIKALESIGLCKEQAVFGITDEKYLTQILIEAKLDEDFYDIVSLSV